MNSIRLSDVRENDSFCLKDLRMRRCIGCVRCLTEMPGRCAIDDGFSEIIPQILHSDDLIFDFSPMDGRVPTSVTKAVERLSNVLEAFTDSGGNVPVIDDSVILRNIIFSIRGRMSDDDFENDMRVSLIKGPVKQVSFSYPEK